MRHFRFIETQHERRTRIAHLGILRHHGRVMDVTKGDIVKTFRENAHRHRSQVTHDVTHAVILHIAAVIIFGTPFQLGRIQMSRCDNRDLPSGTQLFCHPIDSPIQSLVSTVSKILRTIRQIGAQVIFADKRNRSADTDDIPRSIRQFLDQVFNGTVPHGTDHLDIQGIQQVTRRIQQRTRIMVAAHQHDILAAGIQQRSQKAEIHPTRFHWRIRRIEDVSRHNEAFRPEIDDAFPEPVQETFCFFPTIDVMHRITQMPVGGVDELHLIPLPFSTANFHLPNILSLFRQ